MLSRSSWIVASPRIVPIAAFLLALGHGTEGQPNS
jgi:hypothetical protein